MLIKMLLSKKNGTFNFLQLPLSGTTIAPMQPIVKRNSVAEEGQQNNNCSINIGAGIRIWGMWVVGKLLNLEKELSHKRFICQHYIFVQRYLIFLERFDTNSVMNLIF